MEYITLRLLGIKGDNAEVKIGPSSTVKDAKVQIGSTKRLSPTSLSIILRGTAMQGCSYLILYRCTI